MKLVPIDMEFYNNNEPNPTLVCAAFDGNTYWLLDGSDNEQLIVDLLGSMISKETLLAYYAIAEARCLLALGIDPCERQWVDLYVEFRMQQNSQNKYQYGQFLDKEGVERYSHPPIPGEENELNNTKVPSNLINAVFKNTGYRISSAEKEKMRDIILSKDNSLITLHKDRIMQYCLEDTLHLEGLYNAITNSYKLNGLKNFERDILSRGAYAAATAKTEQLGIPINVNHLNKIIEKTPEILQESKNNVNNYIGIFKEAFTKPPKTYKNGNIHTYKEEPARKDTKELNRFIGGLNISDWPLTDSLNPVFKTDKETLEGYRYIPAIDILYNHGKTESSLKWFNRSNGDGFFNAFGSDNKVRPFYGIFGTQTGRNAAKAKTFPFAMSKWLRSLVQPPKGQYIVAADFSQQEVAVAASLSSDKNLRLAYDSGDVYLNFAIQAGMVPADATKKTHKFERDLCKALVLGIQYGMGKVKMRHRLSYFTGKDISMEQTQELITAHKTVFATYWQWIYSLSDQYDRGYPLITPDGWVLWQDNPIKTSVRNAPVQGASASITRQAMVDAWKVELKVMCQLHDALYILTDNPERDKPILARIMREATEKILGKDCIDIRIDFKVYSHEDLWIEEEAQNEWDKIKKHLR